MPRNPPGNKEGYHGTKSGEDDDGDLGETSQGWGHQPRDLNSLHSRSPKMLAFDPIP